MSATVVLCACGHQLPKSRKRCNTCRSNTRRQALKASGLCRCGSQPEIGQAACRECLAVSRDGMITWRSDLKADAIAHYGGVCECCQESNLAFLNIDHIAGNGAAHRLEIGGGSTATYKWLRDSSYPVGFRVLCFNCNNGFRLNHGVCPHAHETTTSGWPTWKLKNWRLKQSTIAVYGGLCECCGIDRLQFLTIDHINGDGAKHRTELFGSRHEGGRRFYQWLKSQGYPDGYRVLCWNCNCGREVNGGTCPHEAVRCSK